jgi:hypothetical protein
VAGGELCRAVDELAAFAVRGKVMIDQRGQVLELAAVLRQVGAEQLPKVVSQRVRDLLCCGDTGLVLAPQQVADGCVRQASSRSDVSRAAFLLSQDGPEVLRKRRNGIVYLLTHRGSR